jgi:hypothetical protein
VEDVNIQDYLWRKHRSSKASHKTHHYIVEENNLDYVDKKDGQYVKYSRGKRVPNEPQPDSANIIVFKRYYISLKRNPSFKKRISTVTECPEELLHIKNIAVAEYIGDFPQNNIPRGNSKNITGDYVHTSDAL